jgi:hypothetical protein
MYYTGTLICLVSCVRWDLGNSHKMVRCKCIGLNSAFRSGLLWVSTISMNSTIKTYSNLFPGMIHRSSTLIFLMSFVECGMWGLGDLQDGVR